MVGNGNGTKSKFREVLRGTENRRRHCDSVRSGRGRRRLARIGPAASNWRDKIEQQRGDGDFVRIIIISRIKYAVPVSVSGGVACQSRRAKFEIRAGGYIRSAAYDASE